ncbi:gamma-glutamylaminecyclotransferase-like [Rhipicephalus sanguineus]|uniref:gamma-glutamylaminecyclotransferase-like n=1 Tax=Rhipicephalus sanguineus TaxID=34632 RepID=UPI001895B321|nr:gamma-glutamylaminecyclotransferase-like [Rhipicephalus sanguineus]
MRKCARRTSFDFAFVCQRRCLLVPAALAQDTHSVFVYGTLKIGESHHFFLEDPENGRATLLGNAETIDEWPLVVVPSSGIPYLIPAKGEGYRVMGEVYTVDDDMLAKLDEIESVPDRYYREELDVQLLDQPDDSEGPFKAWNYFATHYEEMLQLPYISNFTTN